MCVLLVQMCRTAYKFLAYNGEEFKLAGTVSRPRPSLVFSLAYTDLANTSHRHMRQIYLFVCFIFQVSLTQTVVQ
jgi:hypothetical protein